LRNSCLLLRRHRDSSLLLLLLRGKGLSAHGLVMCNGLLVIRNGLVICNGLLSGARDRGLDIRSHLTSRSHLTRTTHACAGGRTVGNRQTLHSLQTLKSRCRSGTLYLWPSSCRSHVVAKDCWVFCHARWQRVQHVPTCVCVFVCVCVCVCVCKYTHMPGGREWRTYMSLIS